MLRFFTALAVLLPIFVGGCSAFGWQASSASQGLDINPLNWGTGQSVISPSNAPGFTNGEPLDMRSRR
ncbi:MAG TPA: hypothetical protein VFE62_12190 [Gemmataceae bacterium]|nr:hypothetical protein [Gemmataceae bacterium]